ncbi:MAG: hypothetical protein ACPGPF_11160, partial [Pontibacterium sp.]
NNKPGQVVIEAGMLSAASYDGVFGVDALAMLKDIPDIRFSFTQGMVYPVVEQLDPSETPQILIAMGLVEKDEQSELTYRGQHTTPNEPALEGKKKTMTYRGQTVQIEEPDSKASASGISQEPSTKKKPTRMYRGRPVYD